MGKRICKPPVYNTISESKVFFKKQANWRYPKKLLLIKTKKGWNISIPFFLTRQRAASFFILNGGESDFLFEESAEIIRIVKSRFMGDFENR